MNQKIAALSVDLDEIPNYYAIHGLTQSADDPAMHAVYDRAVPRLRELFGSLGVPCTFFVIGSDMDREQSLSQARGLSVVGHELANHSQNHRYDLTRLSRDEIKREVLEGIESVARALGHAPAGFRAPGYTITDELFDVLREVGVAYDSSVFPCPMYWAAKTAMIGWIGLRGRRSHSVVDTPAVLSASADPYRVGEPYWTRSTQHDGMIELPIGVTRGARLPYIGTSVVLAGNRAKWLTQMMIGRPLVNLELHGIDVLGASEDGLGVLAAHQPDVNIPVKDKLETLTHSVQQLQRAGYRFVTLFEAARIFASQ
jgi:peptidoglycan/xylan/chitin deacetylase (PgdA/CDA1 family)